MKITEYLFDLSEGFDEMLDKKIDKFLKIIDLEYKVDEVWEYIKESLKNNYTEISENEIITEAYYGIGFLLENDYKIDPNNIDIYINGLIDSYLHIKNKEEKNIELGNFKNYKEFLFFYFENYYISKDKKDKIDNILNKSENENYKKLIYEKCKEEFLKDLTIYELLETDFNDFLLNLESKI